MQSLVNILNKIINAYNTTTIQGRCYNVWHYS